MAQSHLCNTDIYANDVLCEVIAKLDEHHLIAQQQLALANSAIEDLKTAGLAEITSLTNIDYEVPVPSVTSTVDTDWVPPTDQPSAPDYSALAPTALEFPDAPTIEDLASVDTAPAAGDAYAVPSAANALISDADIEDIFDKGADRLARVGVKAERDAVYQQSAMGVGMATAALTMGLAAAGEETNQRTSDAALEHSTQEGTWKREDAKTLHNLHIQNWPLKPRIDLDAYSSQEGLEIEAYKAEMTARTSGYSDIIGGLTGRYGSEVQWTLGYLNAESERYRSRIDQLRADISSEAERRGWSQLELQGLLEEADKATAYALQKAQIILEVTRQTNEAIAQLMVGMVQGVFSAADYGLSGSGQQSVSDTV